MTPFCRDDVVAQHAELAYHSVGVREEVVADSCSAIDDDVRQQNGVVADYDIVVDYDIGADVGVRANLRRRSDDRRGMDAWLRRPEPCRTG